MVLENDWLQALGYLYGLQPIILWIAFAVGSWTDLDRQYFGCASAVFLRHLVGLVFICILGLILVPIRLGLGGIGSSIVTLL